MKRIDLNCDLGESPQAIANGIQEAIMPHITSANIACGGHAGDESTIEATIRQALRYGLAVGAHPGYPDRENFGRIELQMTSSDITETVYRQVELLARTASRYKVTVFHVKPHGALYNQAVNNEQIARAIAAGVSRWNREVVLVGLAGSPMLEVFRDAGFRTAAEAFADRQYESDGTLRSRKLAGALIEEPEAAAAQAVQIVNHGHAIAGDGTKVPIVAQTICIHGDSPRAQETAAAVAAALRQSGVRLQSLESCTNSDSE